MRKIFLDGGPASLFFGTSLKLRNPDADVTVLERNRTDDTFGWCVFLSDETLDALKVIDPISAAEIRKNFAYWDDVVLICKSKKTVSLSNASFAKNALMNGPVKARELISPLNRAG